MRLVFPAGNLLTGEPWRCLAFTGGWVMSGAGLARASARIRVRAGPARPELSSGQGNGIDELTCRMRASVMPYTEPGADGRVLKGQALRVDSQAWSA